MRATADVVNVFFAFFTFSLDESLLLACFAGSRENALQPVYRRLPDRRFLEITKIAEIVKSR